MWTVLGEYIELV